MNTPLTKETIEQATGKNLDWLIATELFGWRWMTSPGHATLLCRPQDAVEDGAWHFTPEPLPEDRREDGLMKCPAFSTTGDGMLLVLEKMRERGWQSDISLILTGVPVVSFWQPYALAPMKDVNIKSEGELPEQICRCALLALLSSDNP